MELEPCPHCGQTEYPSKRHRGQHIRLCRGLPPAIPVVGEILLAEEAKIDPLEARFAEFEGRLGSQLETAIVNVNQQLERIPDLINQSVMVQMQSLAQQPPEQGNPNPPNPGGGALDRLIAKINPEDVISGFTKAKGGNTGSIGEAIGRMLAGKKKGEGAPAQAKYIARGFSQAQAALRMKGIDQDLQAMALKSSAELMLQSKLDAGERGRQIGIKSFVDSFLAGKAMGVSKPAEVKPPASEGGT